MEELPTPEPPPPAREEPTPEPPPPLVEGVGHIKVNSVPWSHIYLDGIYLGRTGAPTFEVPAGPHTVKLFRQETEQTREYEVLVQPDATVNVGCWNFSTNSPCKS